MDQVLIIKKLGWDYYASVCNITDIAIKEDGLDLDNRLSFACQLEDVLNVSIEDLCSIFVFRWECIQQEIKDGTN